MKLIKKLAKEWGETPISVSFTYNGKTTDCGFSKQSDIGSYKAAFEAGFRKAREMAVIKGRIAQFENNHVGAVLEQLGESEE